MNKCVTLKQMNNKGQVKVIALSLVGDTLERSWGQLNGAVQRTEHTYGIINAGKKNELSPEQAAERDYDRVMAKKIKEGYSVEDWSGVESQPEPILNGLGDFSTIPTAYCISKPNAKISETKVNKGLANGNSVLDIKYNGLCHYALCTAEGEFKLFTRRMDDHTAKYPIVVEALKNSGLCMPKSLYVGEMTVDPMLRLPHMEAFKLAQEINKVDTLDGKLKDNQEEALLRQSKNAMRYALFGVLYHAGEDTSQMPYGAMYTKFIAGLPEVNSLSPIFKPERVLCSTVEEAKQYLKENAVTTEGLVAWMLNESMEVTYTGKPMRRAAYKVKLPKEMDVIAYGYEEGKGDHQGKIGALLIGLMGPDGMIVPLGKCGSGLTDEDCVISNWEFPCVIEIIYNERYPTGKFQFPRFSKKHEDKVPEDCIV